MTINTIKGFESGEPIKTKTEVDIHHPLTVSFSRIIDSRIKQYTLVHNEAQGEITISKVATICKLDNEMFKMLSGTQEHEEGLEF